MAARCKVPGCGNKAASGVRLYRVPQDPEKLRLLQDHLNLTTSTWRPGKYDRICDDHFAESGGAPHWLRARNSKSCSSDDESEAEVVAEAEVEVEVEAEAEAEADDEQDASRDEVVPTTIYRVDAHTSSLCQSLYKLTLAEHQFCDVTLKLNVIKKEYKAHSPVLATCSSFFKSILDKPEHRHVKNVVILLPDFIQPEGLEPILLFIYTGDLGISGANITAIYQVAVLFELSAAIALCNKFVESNKLSQTLLSIDHADRAETVPSPVNREIIADEVEDQDASGSKIESCMLEITEQVEGENGEKKIKDEDDDDENDADDDDDDEEDDDEDADFSDLYNDEESAEVTENISDSKMTKVGGDDQDAETPSTTAMEVSITEETEETMDQERCPVRRSLRRQSQKHKVDALSESSSKNNSTKQKAVKTKTKMTKLKRDLKSPHRKFKTESDRSEPPSDNILSKIDPTLKFTDPAKYIAELINKNTDMLNEHGSNTQGGGVQVITRGKITYIFPDGVEVNLPAVVDPSADSIPVAIPADAKVNSEGLPYEKIVDSRTCSECNLSFPSAAFRDEHVESKHPGQSSSLKQVVFQCLTCSFTTDFLRNMWFHCHWKHSYPLPNTLRQYCCGLCDYRAPAQGNIEVHIRRVHTQERPLMCDVCGQFFKSLDTLRGHRFYRHQDIYPFQCNVCEKQFKRRHKLDVHMRIHMGYKPFSCPECQYATYTKFNLKDHMRKRHLKELDSVNKLNEQTILS